MKKIITILLFFVIFIGILIPIVVQKSFGYHDGEFLFMGYSYLKYGNSFNPAGHPILTPALVSIPLLFMNISYPDYSEIINPKTFGYGFLYYGGNNPDIMLFWSKIPLILLGLLLGYYLFKWANELYGFKSSVMALFLFTFSPVVLAFTPRISFDISIAAFFLPSIYHFWKYFKYKKNKDLLLSGVFLGLSILGKPTAILLFVSYGIIGLIFLLRERPKFKIYSNENKFKRLGILSFTLGLILLIATITFFVPYLNEIHPIYPSSDPLYLNAGEYRSLDRLDNILDDRLSGKFKYEAVWFLTKVPVPAPHFFQGIYTLVTYNSQGMDEYFMGEYTSGIKWKYYLASFFIKNPIPLLILIFLTIFLYNRIERKNRDDELFLIIPFFVYFLFLMTAKMHGGIRYFLPIMPLLFLFVSQITNIKLRKKAIKLSFNILLSILLIWYLIGTILVYPDPLAYYNEFIGTDSGYKYFIDSNYDYYQDFNEMKAYITENNLKGFYLNYSNSFLLDSVDMDYNSLGENQVVNGTILINANALEGLFSKDRDDFAWLRNFTPVDRIGNTVFVYNITEEDIKIFENENKFDSTSI